MTQHDDFDPQDMPLQPDGGARPPRRDLSVLPAFLRRPPAGGTPRAAPSSLPGHGAYDEIRPVVATRPDPALLPMISISPRRLLLIVGLVVVAWGLVSFGRQVAAASASSARADLLRVANAQLGDEVAGLQHELQLIQEPRYIDQQARAYRLGGAHEVPFALADGAPTLLPDAPGSAAHRLGADGGEGSPLDIWLRILFGPGG
jgi:hypothetical protein